MTQLRIGIIGTGIMGSGHARYLTNDVDGAQVSALADMDQTRTQALSDELGGDIAQYSEAKDFFANADVDAFIIASPDALHVEHLRLAINRGLPTLCEKPLATNIADAREIAAEVKEFEKSVGKSLIHFGFMRRFDPSYLEVKRLIETGHYGQPLFLRTATRNVHSAGITTEGLLTNIAVHEFDVLRWLFKSEWESVSVHYPKSSSLSPEGLADPIMFMATLKNGILVSADIVANNNYGYDVRTEVVCERGSIEIGIHGDVITRANHIAGVNKGGAMDDNWIPKFTQAYIGELKAWVEGIKLGSPHPDLATVDDGLAATEACEMGLAAL